MLTLGSNNNNTEATTSPLAMKDDLLKEAIQELNIGITSEEEMLQLSEEEKIARLKKEIMLLSESIEGQKKKAKEAIQLYGEDESVRRGSLSHTSLQGSPVSLSPKALPKKLAEAASKLEEEQIVSNEEKSVLLDILLTASDDTEEKIDFKDRQLEYAIHELEEQRMLLEEEGYLLQAQQIHDKIKELYLEEESRIAGLYGEQGNRIRRDIIAIFRTGCRVMERKWGKKTEEFDRQAKDIITKVLERQKWEREQAEKQIRSENHLKKPKFSSNVLNLREKVQKNLKAQQYERANKLHQELRKIEMEEMIEIEKQQETKMQKKLAFLNSKHKQETEALEQRIGKMKNDLLKQKGAEEQKMKNHQQSILYELDLKLKKLQSQRSSFMTKHSSILNSKNTSFIKYFESLPKELNQFVEFYKDFTESIKVQYDIKEDDFTDENEL